MSSQVVQKRSIPHVLRHDEYGSVFTAYPVKLNQIGVLQFSENKNFYIISQNNPQVCKYAYKNYVRHDFGLFDEVVFGHGALFHHFDRYVD